MCRYICYDKSAPMQNLLCFKLETGSLWLGIILIPICAIPILFSIVKLMTLEILKSSCEHLDRIAIIRYTHTKSYMYGNSYWTNETAFDICQRDKKSAILLYLPLILFMLFCILCCIWLIKGIKDRNASQVKPAIKMLDIWAAISALASVLYAWGDLKISLFALSVLIMITHFKVCLKSLYEKMLIIPVTVMDVN